MVAFSLIERQVATHRQCLFGSEAFGVARADRARRNQHGYPNSLACPCDSFVAEIGSGTRRYISPIDPREVCTSHGGF